MLPNYFVYVVDMGGYTPAILDSLIIRRVPRYIPKDIFWCVGIVRVWHLCNTLGLYDGKMQQI